MNRSRRSSPWRKLHGQRRNMTPVGFKNARGILITWSLGPVVGCTTAPCTDQAMNKTWAAAATPRRPSHWTTRSLVRIQTEYVWVLRGKHAARLPPLNTCMEQMRTQGVAPGPHAWEACKMTLRYVLVPMFEQAAQQTCSSCIHIHILRHFVVSWLLLSILGLRSSNWRATLARPPRKRTLSARCEWHRATAHTHRTPASMSAHRQTRGVSTCRHVPFSSPLPAGVPPTLSSATALPGRLELPTLRFTAPRPHQLSYGSK